MQDTVTPEEIIENVIEINATYDCKFAQREHFIIGKRMDAVSGGIYIHENTVVPDKVIITFSKKQVNKSNELDTLAEETTDV